MGFLLDRESNESYARQVVRQAAAQPVGFTPGIASLRCEGSPASSVSPVAPQSGFTKLSVIPCSPTCAREAASSSPTISIR